MAKDPAFLFYPGDWLGGTMGFSRHEKGAYLDLLMCQFNNGHMGLHMVRAILGEKDYADLWEDILKPKFLVDENGKFYNYKLEYETVRRKEFTEGRRKNLESGTHIKQHMKTHMGKHMENGNGNGNTVGIKIRGKEFSEDKTMVIFPDGETQMLGQYQQQMLKEGTLQPHYVIKGEIE